MADKITLKTLDQYIEEQFGPRGNLAREKFEKGFESFERKFLARKRV